MRACSHLSPPDIEVDLRASVSARTSRSLLRRISPILVAASVVVAVLAIDAPPDSSDRVMGLAAGVQGCTIQWSVPETLRTAQGRLVMVDAHEIAPWRTGWAMVGRLALETDTLGRIIRIPDAPRGYLRAGFLLRDDEIVEPIPAPDAEVFAFPRIASTPEGGALLVWGRPTDMESQVDEVWSAEFDGTMWTNVQRVAAGEELAWSPTYHSRLIVAGDELRLLAGRTRVRQRSGAVMLRWSRGRWTTVPLRMPTTSYIQVAELPGDTLVVAYVAGAEPHGNTLFVQRVDLGGNALGERLRVSPPSAGVVYDPRMITTTDSTLYLVWSGWPSPPSGVRSAQHRAHVYLASSSDLGRVWRVSEGPLVDLLGPSMLTAMVDSGGAVHVSTRFHRDGVSWPGHLTWKSEAWYLSEPPRAPDGALVGAPVTVLLPNDSLRMVWLTGRVSDRVGDVVTTPGMMLSSRGAMTCLDAPEDHPPSRRGQ